MQQYLMHRGAFAQKDVTIHTWHPPPAVKVDMLNSHLASQSWDENRTKMDEDEQKCQVKPVFDPSLKKLHMFQFAKKSLPSRSETEIKNGDARCALAKHSSIDSIAPLSSTSINAGKFSTSVDQVPLDSIQICPCFHDLPRFSTQLPCPALGIPAPQELHLHGKQCKMVKKGWLSCHI